MRPMLACAVPLEDLRLPMLGSPKIDGIRGIVDGDLVYSRSLKPIRNRSIQELLGTALLHGFDGELTSGSNFQDCGKIMAFDGGDDFTYHVFDMWTAPNAPFTERYNLLRTIISQLNTSSFPGFSKVRVVEQAYLESVESVLEYEAKCLSDGYEGIILRAIQSPYKYGRSTANEQYLVKRKPFEDEEATIIGFEEQNENTNLLQCNELGYAKRSSAKDGMRGKGTLGKFLVQSDYWGTYRVGTGIGLGQVLRQHIWDNQHEYLGKQIKVRYQAYGVKDKPRIGIFLGFRDPDDL